MAYPLAPTALLPALGTLHTCTAAHIADALQALRDVYFPRAPPHPDIPVLKQSLSVAVPAVRRRAAVHLVHHDGVPDSGYASAEDDDYNDEKEDDDETEGEEKLDILRADAHERRFAIRWLTGLVKRGDAWAATGPDGTAEHTARAVRLDDAARLLARFAGDDAPEEALTRRFAFALRLPTAACPRCGPRADAAAQTVAVALNDAPVDGSDHTAVGLQSWGSAVVLAARLCADPARYLGALHPCAPASGDGPRRVLELGAGTGLLSIAAAQVLARAAVAAVVRATDGHRGVLANLAQNVRHNPSAVGVSVAELDWARVDEDGDGDGDGDGAYDVVLAADVVYYPDHTRWIRGCVARMMRKSGVFWLIMPLRTTGRHEGLGETVEAVFAVAPGDAGERLAIVGREEVARMDGVGRADEAGYRLFEIRWV